MTEPAAPLPTFLIIGAQKSATRWLRMNLGQHPDVFTAGVELSFFNSNGKYRQGADYYRSMFEGWSGEPIVGEATPGYMFWRHRPERVAERIKETIPDVRLIALLRDPIERANSAMIHHTRRHRLRKGAKLLSLTRGRDPLEDRLCLVTGGWYAASLEPYRDLFGDQLMIVLHDDVREDPRWVYERSLAHIGASTDFVSPELSEVVFSNQERQPGVNSTTVPDEERKLIWPLFAEDVARLEWMTGRRLARWDPTDETREVATAPPDIAGLLDAVISAVVDMAGAIRIEQLDQPVDAGGAADAGDAVDDEADADIDHDTDHDTDDGADEQTVRDLLIEMTSLLLDRARRIGSPDAVVPDVLAEPGSDPVRALRTAGEILRAALVDPTRWTARPHGEIAAIPVRFRVATTAITELLHALDLARATGLELVLPDELARPLADFAAEQIRLSPSGAERMAQPLPVPDGASPLTRLFALIGREYPEGAAEPAVADTEASTATRPDEGENGAEDENEAEDVGILVALDDAPEPVESEL